MVYSVSNNIRSRTKSDSKKGCESDFLAIIGTKEHEFQICYRCFLSGMARL